MNIIIEGPWGNFDPEDLESVDPLVRKDFTRELVKRYLKVNIQYGHKPKKWNPKMAPYILREKHGFHVFNLIKTLKFLKIAGKALRKKAYEGKQILFVDTKKTSSHCLSLCAKEAKSFYIESRWLGGMLTNWPTLQRQIKSLTLLEKDFVEGNVDRLAKKEQRKLRKELEKLRSSFGGIRGMKSLPDIVIFMSQTKEKSALLECQKLGIPTICVVDSNCDPDLTPYPIPANSESPASVCLILKYLANQVKKGKAQEFADSYIIKKTSTFLLKQSLFRNKLSKRSA